MAQKLNLIKINKDFVTNIKYFCVKTWMDHHLLHQFTIEANKQILNEGGSYK